MAKRLNLGALPSRSLSVLVPVLNEGANLAPTVERLIEALSITIEDFEIIIVNDGSSDDTEAVADGLANSFPTVRAIHNARNMGLGFSYARGYEEARKEFFVYIPGDNTWPYRSFVELFGNIGRADIITSYAINPEVRPFGRRIISKMYTHALCALFGRRLQYFNGLTIYPVSFLRRRPVTTFGFGFQAEVLLKAIASGLSYIEVGLPIDERTAGGSKAVNLRNIVSVAWTIMRLVFEIRLTDKWKRERGSGHGASISSRQGAFVSLDELGFSPDDPALASPKTIDVKSPRKIVVIAGASSGIGQALAEDLANAGHTVFACSRSMDNLKTALGDRPEINLFVCDVSNEESVKSFATFVGKHSGYIDILINCAGGFGAIGPIDKVDSSDWMRTIAVNLGGTFSVTKNFLPLLEGSEVPQIINFAGGGAFSPFPNFSAYACSKAAVVRLTETLAVELASRGISVNAIAPGVIPTKAHEATIAAGEARAGSLYFRRTERLMSDRSGSARMDTVQKCVRALISEPYQGLTGKTISANFDPWPSEDFLEHIDGINRSELYTMRRTNLVNLPEGHLRASLMRTWAKHSTRR